MKVFVVLALAVFTGCNANIMQLNQPNRQQMDMVKDAFWDYVNQAGAAVEESMRQMRTSELGSEMNTLLTQSTEAINQFADSLQAQASPISQEIVTRLTQESERVKARLDADLTVLGNQLQPYVEEVVAEVWKKVEELKKEAEPYTGPVDADSLIQRSTELREQLDRSIEQLQAEMTPFAEEMKEKVQKGVDELLKTQMNMDAEELQGRLTQLGEELKAKLNTDTKILRRQLKDLWRSFMEMTQ